MRGWPVTSQYKGIIHPIQKTPYGLFHSGDDISQIKSSLLAIVLTRTGERVCEPFFGTPLHQVNLTSPKEMMENQVSVMVAKSVKFWEKRIQVKDIKTLIEMNETGELLATISVIFIVPNNIKEEHLFTLQTPLGN